MIKQDGLHVYSHDEIDPSQPLWEDKPEEGKQYLLIGGPNDKCIANGNTWKESKVKED